MKLSAILTLALLASPYLLFIGGSANPSNLWAGITPPALFSTTNLYTTVTAAITSLTAMSATVTVASSSAIWTIVAPAVTAIAQANIANFNTLTQNLNTHNTFLSNCNNADSNYKRKYKYLNVTLTQMITNPTIPSMYNAILPSINQTNFLVANMTLLNTYFSGNLTQLGGLTFNLVNTSNFLFGQLSQINANMANSLSSDLSMYGAQLNQYMATQTPILNNAASMATSYTNNAVTLMANYPASVPIYLNQLLSAKSNSMNAVMASINSLTSTLTTLNNNYPSLFLANQTTLLSSVDSMVASSITALNNLMAGTATSSTSSYTFLLNQLYTANNYILAIQNNLPYMNAELLYSQRLLNWAFNKTQYDMINLLNYQMMWTTSIANLLTQFDNLIISENHFLNELSNPPAPNAFNLVTSTYIIGAWNSDIAANFPGGLTTDQASRLKVYSFLICPYSNNPTGGFTPTSSFRVSTLNSDTTYSFEAYMGYSVSTTAPNLGIMGYIAVSDPLASSTFLSINVEYVSTAVAGTTTGAGSSSSNTNLPTSFTPMFVPAF